MHAHSGGNNSIFIFPAFSNGGQLSKGKNLLLYEQILSFKSKTHFQWDKQSKKANRKSEILFPPCKNGIKHCHVPMNLRGSLTLLHSERPKL